MKKETISTKVSFPQVTEVRIGTALRVAITYYLMLNNTYEGVVDKDRLEDVLKDLKFSYRFGTIKNYVKYLNHELLFMNFKNLQVNMEVSRVNKNVESCGEKVVPITVIEYLNEILLPKLVDIAITNMEEDEPEVYQVVIPKDEYVSIYEGYMDTDITIKVALSFIESMLSWLEYNLIVKVQNVYINPSTKDIVFPVKFSFLKSIK
ncbi:MAG: hypothetical protein IJ809_06225 [Clostridia bacterium]|nr:hypothetical protein [Clostridia bacterium]